jgi:hypothetical protein
MAKKNVRVSEEEMELLTRMRNGEDFRGPDLPAPAIPSSVSEAARNELAEAFVSAIERTKPMEKKTVFTRKVNTPWSPPEGTPRTKLKRKFFHHGIGITTKVTNEEIELLNKIRPGVYCDGFVRVTLRKDRGIDIDYPVKTASQRLKLVNQFGIRSFAELLQRLIAENADPAKYRRQEDMDLYDDDM